MKKFDFDNKDLQNQFKNIRWIEESGLDADALLKEFDAIMAQDGKESRAVLKAKSFALICEKARIALDEDDIFQDKIFQGEKWGGWIAKQRNAWEAEIREKFLKEESMKLREAGESGSYTACSDFGHTSPNSKLLLEIGFSGLLDRVNAAAKRDGLSEKQKDFYLSCKIALEGAICFVERLAAETEKINKENATALHHIAKGAPQNTYEAMQLLILYFFLHENVQATRVRTLGRLDVLLYPFYKNDLEKGRFTKEEIKDMIRFFFHKLWSAAVPYDLPLCLGGIDEDGAEITNELSYLLVETYNELDIYSPKIHIRVSEQTPSDFVKLVFRCIRGGNSSFVFVNDSTVIKALTGVGIKEKDANNYVPIGCYEPAVWGKEIGCTGNGKVNLAKAVELAITNGLDHKSGKRISIQTGEIRSYEDFISSVKAHIRYMVENGLNYIREIEKHYGEIGPDPLLSAMYDQSVMRGVDVYEGGAEYNNTSYYISFLATLVDSVCAVKRLVFEEKRITFAELCELLKNDWQGNEKLRLIAKSIPEKYGNANPTADKITKEFTDFCASLITAQPNSRGGVFKAANFSIDTFVAFGAKTMATPDGRRAGEILSKNLCATVGQDKKGITALIHSATQIDHSLFPNGTVLDVVLHPSAVAGEDGLCAFESLLKTYFAKGGFALHGNVFSAEELKKAQENPEKYKNLQVRVCGWNAYFVNLTKEEQNSFIKQAECNG